MSCMCVCGGGRSLSKLGAYIHVDIEKVVPVFQLTYFVLNVLKVFLDKVIYNILAGPSRYFSLDYWLYMPTMVGKIFVSSLESV